MRQFYRLSAFLFLLMSLAVSSFAKQPSKAYIDFALKQCDIVQKHMPEITAVAETVAQRHINGGAIDFPWNYNGLQQELAGRAGGPINYGHVWNQNRTDAEKANDIAIISWDRVPAKGEADRLRELNKRGVFIIGFGPKDMPELADCVKECDAFFDSGLPDDRVVKLADGSKAGRANHLVNALYGWTFTAEFVGALTRAGKMPPIWQSWAVNGAKDWSNKYMDKVQFHDDLPPVPAHAAGKLGRRFLDQMRDHMRRFERTQLKNVNTAADLLVKEIKDGKTDYVLSSGHMPWTYVGKFEDARWMKNIDFHSTVDYQIKDYNEKLPQDALAVRLGYYGEDQTARDLYKAKNVRLIEIASDNPYPEMPWPEQTVVKIDMGMAFGDACVKIDGYPLPICPPSGIMQIVAYEAINTEVLARLAKK